jgi:hypothetical protein
MLLMKHVIYSMQFKGTVVPGGEGIMKSTTSATSCSIQSLIGPDGVEGTFHPVEGGLAWFESEVRLAGQHAFTETGTISFGEDEHELRFSTVGEGHMGPSADEKYSAGAVTWKVDGGEGQFEGASGYITSNFIITEDGEVTDYQFGVIFLKQA